LRQGVRLGEGAVEEILGRAQLEALYGTPVQLITDVDGERSAFIPG
jgi:hypothetical protein